LAPLYCTVDNNIHDNLYLWHGSLIEILKSFGMKIKERTLPDELSNKRRI
jgi:hypothetical protein